jgi:ABC-type Fe3+-hydroxamate transport system substrate-binding protein
MLTFFDQLGRDVHMHEYPKRIISLVPSQTELLCDLGLEDEVIGITKFCVHPAEWFRNKTRVGGTKTIRMEIIDSLQPDLIIANKEENTREQIEALAERYPVWISDVNDLQTALQMIVLIGELTGKQSKAYEISNHINDTFSTLSTWSASQKSRLPVVYLIWKDPYMTVGGDTFINSLLNTCGLLNRFEHLKRYPEITIEQMQTAGSSNNMQRQLLFLSSEPYPFTEKHIAELQHSLPGTKMMLVDGEIFSWYGSRLLHAANYFQKLLAEIKTL